MNTQTLTFDEEVARLRRAVAAPMPTFATFDPVWLRGYQEDVLRWAHCAPEGATLLAAPLQGWDGVPLSGRDPLGPRGCPNEHVRAARVALGLHPIQDRRLDPILDR